MPSDPSPIPEQSIQADIVTASNWGVSSPVSTAAGFSLLLLSLPWFFIAGLVAFGIAAAITLVLALCIARKVTKAWFVALLLVLHFWFLIAIDGGGVYNGAAVYALAIALCMLIAAWNDNRLHRRKSYPAWVGTSLVAGLAGVVWVRAFLSPYYDPRGVTATAACLMNLMLLLAPETRAACRVGDMDQSVADSMQPLPESPRAAAGFASLPGTAKAFSVVALVAFVSLIVAVALRWHVMAVVASIYAFVGSLLGWSAVLKGRNSRAWAVLGPLHLLGALPVLLFLPRLCPNCEMGLSRGQFLKKRCPYCDERHARQEARRAEQAQSAATTN